MEGLTCAAPTAIGRRRAPCGSASTATPGLNPGVDLETLVATRGPNFPLGRLEGRLMCPACGNRRVTVVFEPPSNAAQMGSG